MSFNIDKAKMKMNLIELIKESSRISGTIMIDSHLTKSTDTVFRKPIFKYGKCYVRYLNRYYEIISAKKIYKTIYSFQLSGVGKKGDYYERRT